MSLTKNLISWYTANKRNLPWRRSKDPFTIWLSEIILQQTRVEQGLKYYHRFTSEFRNVNALANASEEKILRMWQGLGYYSRARNLHATANQIVKDYHSSFPGTFKELLKLKGVGDYTAAAIASIAFDQAVPAVDGNVKRVISRLFDIRENTGNSTTYNKIKAICATLMQEENPGSFNQAIMEFGALHCKPKNPDCINCPLNSYCMAYSEGMVNELPVKYKTQKKKNRYFNYLIIENKSSTKPYFYIRQRKKNDIWHMLFEFPMIEDNKLLNTTETLKNLETLFPAQSKIHLRFSPAYKHLLSHQNIFAQFIRIKYSKEPKNIPPSWIKIPREKIDDYAIPRLIEQYLHKEN
ncbi:MAG: A/G-specific adenine glycosylase [Bacteroidales bacterium]